MKSLLLAMSLVLTATAASAQTRLYLLLPGDGVPVCHYTGCPPSTLLDVDVDGRRVVAASPVNFARDPLSWQIDVTPDGRQLIWHGAEASGNFFDVAISLFDTTTRTQSVIRRQEASGMSGQMVLDPATPRAFVQRNHTDPSMPIRVIDATGERPLPGQWCDGYYLTTISGDGSRLLLQCSGSMSVIDSRTGAVAGNITAYCNNICLLNHDGSVVYAIAAAAGLSGVLVRRYDVRTGNELSTSLPVFGRDAAFALDEPSGRVVVITEWGGAVFDAVTLAQRSSFSRPGLSRIETPHSVVIDPDRPQAYVLRYGDAETLAVIDTDTGATLAIAPMPSHVAGMVLGPRPPRAQHLAAAQAGSTVTLQWTNATSHSRGTGVVVEAGTAPGLSNLVRFQVAADATSLVVPDVPRGTYYVRVRGLNGSGVGEPSNEVVLVVP